MVREIPIILSTPMVQAILTDLKTMTRRLPGLEQINQDPNRWEYVGRLCYNGDIAIAGFRDKYSKAKKVTDIKCPYGKPGDRLWVRETFFDSDPFKDATLFKGGARFYYKADGSFIGCHKWKPSIHIPKAAARIWLEITDVTVERLQSISEAHAIAEGVERVDSEFKDYTGLVPQGKLPAAYWSFNSLWCKINGEDSWDMNPWVWVISFKVLSKDGRPADQDTSGSINESLKSSPPGEIHPPLDPRLAKGTRQFPRDGDVVSHSTNH